MRRDDPEPHDLARTDRRFELLSEAYGLLLSNDEAEAVIQAIAERVLESLGADVFFNYVLDPGATRLRLNAWGGVPERVAKMIERLELGQAICGCVARDGERIISEDVQHNGDPRAELVRRMGVRSYCCHPLVSQGATVGTLSFGRKSKDRFDPDEIELMRTVAGQVSVAIERSRTRNDLARSAREQAALAYELHETLAEQSTLVSELGRRAERETLLKELVELGASSTTELEAAEHVLEMVTERLGCSVGAILSLDPRGDKLRPLATVGIAADELQRQSGKLGLDGPSLSATTLSRRRSNYVADLEATAELAEPTKALGRRLGVRSAFAASLVVREHPIGTISLAWPDARETDAAGIAFLESIAAEIAIVLSNARFVGVEHERARLGQSMVEIHAALLSSLDVDEALPRVLEELVGQLRGIGGTISERSDEGWLVRSVEGSTARTLHVGRRFRDDEAPALMSLLATRTPVIVDDVPSSGRFNTPVVRQSGIAAFATYPLMLRGEVTGAVTIQFGEPHSFSEGEREYMRRAAFAISLSEENARLYKAEQALADRLQGALLALPATVPGIEFAHAYHSAAESARVGGDFYDVFELDADRVGIVIGDVAGHGIDAAVLTSMVKHTIRAHAMESGKSPGQILALTNQVVYKATPTEMFVTVFLALLDRRDGRMACGNAGHPAGAVVTGAGEVSRLPVTGPILGAFPSVTYEQTEAGLQPGDLLFLYTDGLTEARRDGHLFGEDRVLALLAGDAGKSPSIVVTEVADAAVTFAECQLRDDLAILAVRRSDGPDA